MLVALIAFAGVALSAFATAGIAVYRIRTVDRRTANTTEVEALWQENRKQRREIDELRKKWTDCQYETSLMKLQIADLERRING